MDEQQIPTSEVLDRAADYLETFGWTCGRGWHPNFGAPACLEGALRCCIPGHALRSHPAFTAVEEYLTTSRPAEVNPHSGTVIPFSWNDAPGRTAEEVIEVLRAVAVIEAAREDAALLTEVAP